MADRIDGVLVLLDRNTLPVMVCVENGDVRLVVDCGSGLATFRPDRLSHELVRAHLEPASRVSPADDPLLPIAG